MTTYIEEKAREALMRCIDKPRYLEAYQPEIEQAIREVILKCSEIAHDSAKLKGVGRMSARSIAYQIQLLIDE